MLVLELLLLLLLSSEVPLHGMVDPDDKLVNFSHNILIMVCRVLGL